MAIGGRIRKLRESKGMSQSELADKIHVKRQTLYKYENDIITNIPSDKIEEIARVLDSSESFIMRWENVPNPSDTDSHMELIELFNSLSDENKKTIIKLMKAMNDDSGRC